MSSHSGKDKWGMEECFDGGFIPLSLQVLPGGGKGRRGKGVREVLSRSKASGESHKIDLVLSLVRSGTEGLLEKGSVWEGGGRMGEEGGRGRGPCD